MFHVRKITGSWECTVAEFVVEEEEEEMIVHPLRRGRHLHACVHQDSALLLAAAYDNNGEHSMHINIIVWIIVDH